MTKDAKSPSVSSVPEPDWVANMREHYSRTGAYRQSDLVQLLGKPWDTVQIGVSGNLELTSKALRHDD